MIAVMSGGDGELRLRFWIVVRVLRGRRPGARRLPSLIHNSILS